LPCPRSKTVCIIGAFDSKGAEYAFLCERIIEHGHHALTANTGMQVCNDGSEGSSSNQACLDSILQSINEFIDSLTK